MDYATFIATYPQFASTADYSQATVEVYIAQANRKTPAVSEWSDPLIRDDAVGYYAGHLLYSLAAARGGNAGQIEAETVVGEYSIRYAVPTGAAADFSSLASTNFGRQYQQLVADHTLGLESV